MRVLVVDDEAQMRRVLQLGLERNGYTVLLASSGAEALDTFALHPPDLVILDLGMPGMDGLTVCRHIREWSNVPIVVLSVRDRDEEKIATLDLGADDYLTKPFNLGELLARMRAVLRRANSGEDPEPASFTAADLEIDFARRRVTRGGEELRLTPTEYDLLRCLALNADRVLTHRQILVRLWGEEYGEDTQTLRVHIANLRGKIEPDSARPRFIHTEPRVGYRFHVDEGADSRG